MPNSLHTLAAVYQHATGAGGGVSFRDVFPRIYAIAHFLRHPGMTPHEMGDAAALLACQLLVVLTVTRMCGKLAQKLRQPKVVGEIAGGLLLGPMVLGRLAPQMFGVLFSPEHFRGLEIVSSIGLVLFLFLTGAEVDVMAMRRNRGATLGITMGSIGLPFVAGAVVAPVLRARFGLPHVSAVAFTLFIGIAMSITALPVLARIVEERRRAGHALGREIVGTALVSAAVNDVVAWSLLALALSLSHSHESGNNMTKTLLQLGALAVYITFVLLVIRPYTKKLLIFSRRTPRTWLWVPCALVFAYLSARTTEALGVHLFFGAFLAGLCVPITNTRGVALNEAFEKTVTPVVRFALPVFFAMTGLRMRAGALPHHTIRWLMLVLGVALVGKIAGGMAPARLTGMKWKAAAQIGVLMNTRGLVELIALNIGLTTGVLSPTLFSMFVLMAVVTTAMTVPLLDALDFVSARTKKRQAVLVA